MPTDPNAPPPEAIDLAQLEGVTGGTTPTTVGSTDFTNAVSSLASQLKNLDNIKQSSGFDNNTMLVLAFMAMETRGGFGGGGGGPVIFLGRGGRRGCW